MNIKETVKRLARGNALIETLAYLAQNNLLHHWMNFSGDGGFAVTPEEIARRCRTLAEDYISRYRGDLTGKCILEIGTGRSLLTAFFIADLTQARMVYTYDYFEQVFYDIDRPYIEEHFPHITNVQYVHGPGALRSIAQPVDYIFSNAVLEHVWNMPELIADMRTLCTPQSWQCHRIDFSNHNKFTGKGELYFHRFSETLWRLMADNVGHPNRLFMSDYRRLFQQQGFSCETLEAVRFSEDEVRDALRTYLSKRGSVLRFEDLLYKGAVIGCRLGG